MISGGNPGHMLLQLVMLTTTLSRLILIGHDGDALKQPAWTKDGSFMVFRDLQQLVPEFDQ
jgi:deferrochelatase/peroxidase EfeB